MTPKIYDVQTSRFGNMKTYRILLVNADSVSISQLIPEQIPMGWRIENVSEVEAVVSPRAFVLSVTEKI